MSKFTQRQDPQFPDVKLWDKYYPALGARDVTVHAIAGGVNTPVNAQLIGSPDDVNIEDSVVPSDGKAIFHLDGSNITSGAVPNIPIEFSWNVNGQTITDVITYQVEDAYNTDMASVINGNNVFVYDKDHAGLTPTTIAYGSGNGEMVDRLQMLLNEVVPRKQSVGTNYSLLTEDGIYGDNTISALDTYKTYFDAGVDMTSDATQQQADGTVSYGSTDNTSDTYRALMKWYGLVGSSSAYLNKLVDRETLTGWNGYDASDVQVNNGVSITDTGLYDLYENVVNPFTQAMMFSAVAYITESTDNWYARTGQGPVGSANPHGPGMSYCNGCKDTIDDFNAYVAHYCGAPSKTTINSGYSAYRGNLDDNKATCPGTVGWGNRHWPGLIETELNTSTINQPFWPTYWSGIDCSGLVQRVTNYAENLANSSGKVIVTTNIPQVQWSHKNNTVSHAIPSGGFFDPSITYHIDKTLTDKIHRGDLVSYKGHISMVYCTPDDDPTGECAGLEDGEYKIIHASGDNHICYGLPGESPTCTPFNRKVTINTINNLVRGTLGNPVGFGRIILWK